MHKDGTKATVAELESLILPGPGDHPVVKTKPAEDEPHATEKKADKKEEEKSRTKRAEVIKLYKNNVLFLIFNHDCINFVTT